MTDALGKVSELAQQIITLSIGIVTLTMTFAETFFNSEEQDIGLPWTLMMSWMFFAASIIFSVLVLMGVIGNMNRLANNQKPLIKRGRKLRYDQHSSQGAYAPNLKRFGFFMLISFTIGFFLVMITGFYHYL